MTKSDKDRLKSENTIHIGLAIRDELEKQERSKSWFMRQLNQHRTNAYNIFSRKSIDTDTLFKVSDVLGVNFFALYSEEYKKLHDE